ncbi:MAG TPA: PSD1 and planctomycete cytochrome C domain-containing protein [Bryobacteraceae bacterium]|nr:PSD1 and planctomycete cytochrome C domain-containing protein [Bryobacteraceae bacterium]
MSPVRLAAAATVLVLLGWSQNPAAPTVDFARDVHPIIATHCLGCHSAEKRSGGLSLATYADVIDGGRSGAVVHPGNSANSLILARLTGTITPQMPFGLTPLSTEEIATIKTWIDQGARETPTSDPAKGKWEAPLTLEKPSVPDVTWKDWTSPIDRIVSAYLAKNGATEPKLVSDGVFARRVWLDVQGLLPPPDQLQAFLDDQSPNKREALVKRLLANNEQYAENWMSFWNDMLRNDEGVNYFSENAGRKSISDWLFTSLKTNAHYDEMVRKLLNPRGPNDPGGFLQGVNWRGTVSASQTPAMQAAQNTAQIFLGINLKCNSCHDSFISKWKLKDAYSLAAYFTEDDRLELYRCDVAQHQYAQAAFLYPELSQTPKSDSQEDRRAAAAAIFTDPRNGRLPRTMVNRIWQRLLGRGIVENPDEMDGEPWSPALLDWVASDFVNSHYDLKHLMETILTSRTYQMQAIPQAGEAPKEYTFKGPEVRRITAEEFADAIGSITGKWEMYTPPRTPDYFATTPAGTAPIEAARNWRVAANPLTRALGRPIRDQVYSTRDNQATTLQALELTNGETLTHWLLRGAQSMLAEIPPPPKALFDTPYSGRAGVPFDIDVSKSTKLWLLVRDEGSYSPEKLATIWNKAGFDGPNGRTDLADLKPEDPSGLRAEFPPEVVPPPPPPPALPPVIYALDGDGVRVKAPSMLVYDIAGKGFTRFYGIVGVENKIITSDLAPKIRFLIFDQKPDMERLTPIEAGSPVPPPPALKTSKEVVDRVFHYALGRAPSPAERDAAQAALFDSAHPDRVSAEGLADLLWAVLMKPEFQLIY